MVNFIHYFGYLEFGYMEFLLIWDILAGTNAFLVSGIVCITQFSAQSLNLQTRFPSLLIDIHATEHETTKLFIQQSRHMRLVSTSAAL